HPVRDVWLPVLRIGLEAENAVLAGREIHRDIGVPARRQHGYAAHWLSGRGSGLLVDPRRELAGRLAGRQTGQEKFMQLRSRVVYTDHVLSRRERRGELVAVVAHGDNDIRNGLRR